MLTPAELRDYAKDKRQKHLRDIVLFIEDGLKENALQGHTQVILTDVGSRTEEIAVILRNRGFKVAYDPKWYNKNRYIISWEE